METKIWSMQSDLKHSLNTESDVIECWPLTCLDASHIAYATLHTFQLMSNLLNGHFELLYTTLFIPGEISIIIKKNSLNFIPHKMLQINKECVNMIVIVYRIESNLIVYHYYSSCDLNYPAFIIIMFADYYSCWLWRKYHKKM